MSGNALVVYDPGSAGTVKDVAGQMASDLAAQGYFVYLAGIDSATAKGNASQYQVVIVGGPLDNGKASGAVQSYLENLYQGNGTRIGVFGVGNSDSSNDQIAPLPSGSSLTIKETLEIDTSQNTKTQSTEFVTQLLS
jgi:menaquinone-dependent protoporphyrinogen IX oxidase